MQVIIYGLGAVVFAGFVALGIKATVDWVQRRNQSEGKTDGT